MKKLYSFLVLVCLLLGGCAQSQSVVTTFILVRHAEKANDGSKDPDLSEEGKIRANELARVLENTQVDAIYSTNFKRTLNTIQPLADAKKLPPSIYNPMKGEDMDKILNDHKGGTVVVSGHSNTTPWVANYFIGENKFSDFKETDYDNILILSVVDKGNTKVTWINYGAPTE